MLLATLALPALAATWTAEDLVVAHARGLPPETTARMAESVTLDDETTVYLLRRGVPGEAIRAWGHPVREAEGMTALRLGPLDSPAFRPRPAVEPATVQAVHDAVYEELAWRPPPVDAYRKRSRTVGTAGMVVGALVAVAGGVGVAYGARGGRDYKLVGDADGDGFTIHMREQPGNLGTMMLGSFGLVTGGLSVYLGMEQVTLGGPDRDLPRGGPWTD